MHPGMRKSHPEAPFSPGSGAVPATLRDLECRRLDTIPPSYTLSSRAGIRNVSSSGHAGTCGRPSLCRLSGRYAVKLEVFTSLPNPPRTRHHPTTITPAPQPLCAAPSCSYLIPTPPITPPSLSPHPPSRPFPHLPLFAPVGTQDHLTQDRDQRCGRDTCCTVPPLSNCRRPSGGPAHHPRPSPAGTTRPPPAAASPATATSRVTTLPSARKSSAPKHHRQATNPRLVEGAPFHTGGQRHQPLRAESLPRRTDKDVAARRNGAGGDVQQGKWGAQQDGPTNQVRVAGKGVRKGSRLGQLVRRARDPTRAPTGAFSSRCGFSGEAGIPTRRCGSHPRRLRPPPPPSWEKPVRVSCLRACGRPPPFRRCGAGDGHRTWALLEDRGGQ